MHPWDVNDWVILKHFFEALRIGCFSNIINFLVDGALKFPVNAHEIDKFARIHKAVYHPDDKFQRAQIHADKLFDIGPLNFDGHLLTGRGENSFMHLSK